MTEPIAPWRAAVIQMPTEILWPHAVEDVPAVVAHNIDVATTAVRAAMAAEPRPSLVLLPEYAFSGQPNGGTVEEWLARGCASVPGPITDHFAVLATSVPVTLSPVKALSWSEMGISGGITRGGNSTG